MRARGSVTRRERLELMTTALIPAAVGLLDGWIGRGGRLSWLLPLAALPVGLLLAGLWERSGGEGLPGLIRRTCGRATGGAMRGLYLLWGLWLLGRSALACTDRLLAAAQLPVGRWPLLTAALLLTMWLGRSPGRYARTGRIFYLSTAVTLGAVGLLALPSLRWENLLPPSAAPEGVLLGGLEVLSLTGYAVYGLCQPVRGERLESGGWVTAEALALSAMLFVVVGAFGPVLALELDQPFLYILKGVGVPGAFQRGEAVLAAVLALADLVLLGLLAKGCEALLPEGAWRRCVVFGGGMALAVIGGSGENGWLWSGGLQLFGGLLLGTVVPVLLIWRDRGAGGRQADTISCGQSRKKREDIGDVR